MDCLDDLSPVFSENSDFEPNFEPSDHDIDDGDDKSSVTSIPKEVEASETESEVIESDTEHGTENADETSDNGEQNEMEQKEEEKFTTPSYVFSKKLIEHKCMLFFFFLLNVHCVIDYLFLIAEDVNIFGSARRRGKNGWLINHGGVFYQTKSKRRKNPHKLVSIRTIAQYRIFFLFNHMQYDEVSCSFFKLGCSCFY